MVAYVEGGSESSIFNALYLPPRQGASNIGFHWTVQYCRAQHVIRTWYRLWVWFVFHDVQVCEGQWECDIIVVQHLPAWGGDTPPCQ